MQMTAKATCEDIFDSTENKWNVNIYDFDPGGRLYGIYAESKTNDTSVISLITL
jgi:hypothetical protein